MKNNHWLWLFIFFLGCSTPPKQLLMSVDMLSLSEHQPPQHALVRKDFVSIKYCHSDERDRKDAEDLPKEWGILDRLLRKAELQTKSVYFVKATVYTEENCLLMRAYPTEAAGASAPAPKSPQKSS